MKKVILVLLGLALVGFGVYWFVIKDTPQNAVIEKANKPPTIGEAIKATFVNYTDDGFNPAEYYGVVGRSLTVQNNSSSELDFESDDHPSHATNEEFNLGIIMPGKNKTFKLTKEGSFGFHNDNKTTHVGKVTVVK